MMNRKKYLHNPRIQEEKGFRNTVTYKLLKGKLLLVDILHFWKAAHS